MGMRTDLMSLGAIGLGTAVAVVGTGLFLFAGAAHEWQADACFEIAEAGPSAAPAAFGAPPVPAAPGTIPRDVQINIGCATDRVEVRRQVDEIRVRVHQQVEASRVGAEAVRAEIESPEFQALLRDLRAEAEGSQEISNEVRDRVEAALAEAAVSVRVGN